MSKNEQVLPLIVIAPLDWGFGHATRMLPFVRWLAGKYRVVVAAPAHLHFLFYKEPAIFQPVKGYYIRYFNMPVWLSLVLQIPHILVRVIQTRFVVRKIIKAYKPDLIISDNRPFFRSKKVPSLYVTHQITVQHTKRVIQKLLNHIHHTFINRFDACLVPDTTDHFFAGQLSKGVLNIPAYYIGGVTRFVHAKKIETKYFNKICVLSGPEPARSYQGKQMMMRWKNKSHNLIIGAISGNDKFITSHSPVLASHLNDNLFYSIIKNSKAIIVRSGYSSLMDLYYMQKPTTLLPTKGQTEQEYLARYHQYKISYTRKPQFASKEQIIKIVNKFVC